MRSIISPNVSSAGLLLLCLHINLRWINSFSPSFVATARGRHASTRRDRRQQQLCMSSGNELREVPPGKVVVRRHLYKFSPTQQSVENKYAIEERLYYSVGEDRSLKLLGDKSIIFRGDGSVEENKDVAMVGPALYTLQGLQDEKDSESCYAMTLYCMNHPELVSGKGLEVGSGVGLGGILSSIGAGVASGSTQKLSADGEPEAPVPSSLSNIMLTDSNEKFLKKSINNLVATSFPAANVELANLGWERVPKKLLNQFDFIMGCDPVENPSVVDPLANIVANCLKAPASTNQEGAVAETTMPGSLIFISPQQHDSIGDLELKLEWSYGMNTKMNDFTLERIDLTPLVIDNVDVVQDFDGNADVKSIYTKKYSVLSNFDPTVNYQTNTDAQLEVMADSPHVEQLYSSAASATEQSVVSSNESVKRVERNVETSTIQAVAESEKRVERKVETSTIQAIAEVEEHGSTPAPVSSLSASGASYLDQLGGGVSLGKPAPPLKPYVVRGPQSYTDQLSSSSAIAFTYSSTTSYLNEPSGRAPSDGSVVASQSSIPDSSTNAPASPTSGGSYLDQFGGGVALGKAAPPLQSSVASTGPQSYTDRLSSGGASSEPSKAEVPPMKQQIPASAPTPTPASSSSSSPPATTLSESELRELEKSVEVAVEKSVEAILNDIGYKFQ